MAEDENPNPETPAPETPAETPPPEPTPPPGDADKPSTKFNTDVLQAIAEKTPGLRAVAVNHFAGIELKKRELALIKVIDKFNEARKELAKLWGSGTKTFGRDKKPVGDPVYDKKTIDDISKKEGEIAKLEGAIAKALDPVKPDYQKVKELGGGN